MEPSHTSYENSSYKKERLQRAPSRFYIWSSRSSCAPYLRIRAENTIATCWCLYHAFNCNCTVVCGIRCSFFTHRTEIWTHISGHYTFGGNPNSCNGYAHATNDFSDCGNRLERSSCLLQARYIYQSGSSFLYIIHSLFIVHLCR
uniref:Uncharacterized protein n=1 Tax=Trichobilharzia regenti TaxID=157069 RepID=A0AA85J2Q9_TRIRE|nr:unnamed protein product [Trichobilharzia regenti]